MNRALGLHPKVIAFLKSQIEAGHDLDTVQAILERSGYDRKDVEEAIGSLMGAPEEAQEEQGVEEAPTLEESEVEEKGEQQEEQKEEKPEEAPKEKGDKKAEKKRKAEEKKAAKLAKKEEAKRKKEEAKAAKKKKEEERRLAKEEKKKAAKEKKLSQKEEKETKAEAKGEPSPPPRLEVEKSPEKKKSSSERGYLSILKTLLFAPTRFLEDQREREFAGAFAVYVKTLLLVAPLNLVALIIIDHFTTTAPSIAFTQKLLLFLAALFGGYLILTLLWLILSLPLHLGISLVGGKKLSNTTKSMFFALTPAMATLWLPIINALYILYAKLFFLELIKKHHNIGFGRAFWGAIVGVLFAYTLLAILVVTLSLTLGFSLLV